VDEIDGHERPQQALQHRGVGRDPGRKRFNRRYREMIEDSEGDPGVENLTAPTSKNQFYNLVHRLLHATSPMM
jgi:hypothetical protein